MLGGSTWGINNWTTTTPDGLKGQDTQQITPTIPIRTGQEKHQPAMTDTQGILRTRIDMLEVVLCVKNQILTQHTIHMNLEEKPGGTKLQNITEKSRMKERH